MQTFTKKFYVNEETFALGSQILFPVMDESQKKSNTEVQNTHIKTNKHNFQKQNGPPYPIFL